MGYNLKNDGNGKSMSKIKKHWPSLRPLASKDELLGRFKFSKLKKICMEKVVGEQNLAPLNFHMTPSATLGPIVILKRLL